ncbi:MAG: hypothetical protein ACYTEV_00160 [Planctomycetota bacterium]|jgi:hypothetical protein
MRQNTKNRTTQGLLAANLVLMGFLAWGQVAEQPLVREAAAQSRTGSDNPVRFPNAASQRAEMIKALKSMERKIEENSKILRQGLTVEVSNLDEITIEVPRQTAGGTPTGG